MKSLALHNLKYENPFDCSNLFHILDIVLNNKLIFGNFRRKRRPLPTPKGALESRTHVWRDPPKFEDQALQVLNNLKSLLSPGWPWGWAKPSNLLEMDREYNARSGPSTPPFVKGERRPPQYSQAYCTGQWRVWQSLSYSLSLPCNSSSQVSTIDHMSLKRYFILQVRGVTRLKLH